MATLTLPAHLAHLNSTRPFDGTFTALPSTSAPRAIFNGRRVIALTDHGAASAAECERAGKPAADFVRYGAHLEPIDSDEGSVWHNWRGTCVWATPRELGMSE